MTSFCSRKSYGVFSYFDITFMLMNRHQITAMFNRIAHRYDFINRILSFGLDTRWRKKVQRFLPDKEHMTVVDLATGTCDQILALFPNARIEKCIGLDLSTEMLKLGQKKLIENKLEKKVSLELGSALQIPLETNTADCVTISFGIRNVSPIQTCLEESLRVLKPGGKMAILEFSLPQKGFFRPCIIFYLKHILPRIGRLFSKDPIAYAYLQNTISHFPSGSSFIQFMEQAGFRNIQEKRMTFGIVTLYVGEKC